MIKFITGFVSTIWFTISSFISPVEVQQLVQLDPPIIQEVIEVALVAPPVIVEEKKEEIKATSTPFIKKIEEDNIACFCSRWAQENGIDIPDADAIDLKASTTPQVGGGVLFSYGSGIDKHHISKILFLLEYGMWVREANKVPCKITERFVSYNDPYIFGFVPPIKL